MPEKPHFLYTTPKIRIRFSSKELSVLDQAPAWLQSTPRISYDVSSLWVFTFDLNNLQYFVLEAYNLRWSRKQHHKQNGNNAHVSIDHGMQIVWSFVLNIARILTNDSNYTISTNFISSSQM